MPTRPARERGSAVVDYVLVLTVLITLFLGILQLGLVLHVRNTLTAAASDGARAGAPLGATPGDATERTRRLIEGALAARFADDISVTEGAFGGVATIDVRIRAEVPPLGIFGPGVPLDVSGRAVQQVAP